MARSIDARLLALIGDVQGLLELGELWEGLTVALDREVPSDFVSVNEIAPDPADMHSVIRPAVPERLHATWAQHGHQNPLIERFARTRDTRPYRFSDVISQEELHAMTLYQDFYAELGVEYQIAFVVEVSPPRYVGVALSRRKRDFTNTERTLLDRARPYLIGIYRTAIDYTALRAQLRAQKTTGVQLEQLMSRGLTSRQAAVLGLVAHGRSNKDIAVELGVSERTIGKHLQHVYRKLGTTNRSTAAAIAWDLAGPR